MLGGKIPRNRLFWMGAGFLIVTLAVAAFFGLGSGTGPDPVEVAFSDFLGDVQAARVGRVTVGSEMLEFERTDGTRYQTMDPVALAPGLRVCVLSSGVEWAWLGLPVTF